MRFSQSHAIDLNKLELWQLSFFTRLLQIATYFTNCGCLTSARNTRYVHTAGQKEYRVISVKEKGAGREGGREREGGGGGGKGQQLPTSFIVKLALNIVADLKKLIFSARYGLRKS